MTRILLLVVITLSGISCHKECLEFVDYVFELPATLSPAKDTFRIGDTITISSEFPDEVYDRATKRKYKLENFKFFPRINIKNIAEKNSLSMFKGKFDIIIDSLNHWNLFSYNDGSETLIGEYLYTNNKYVLKVKFKVKRSGLYIITLGSGLYILGENQDFDGRCPKRYAALDAYIKMNDGADNNIQMLLDSPDPHYNDWIMQKPEKRFHQFGGYCFYVKE